MENSAFLKRLELIDDRASMAGLRRVFSKGPAVVSGFKILAQLGVPVSDTKERFPYLFLGHLHGSGIPDTENGYFPRILRVCALEKEPEKNPYEEAFTFDRRFDSMVASMTYNRLQTHLVESVPFIADKAVDRSCLLRDLQNWSQKVRDRWIEIYYQTDRRKQ